MNKKDLILLAKEVYPELFGQKQKEIQEQIRQLMEPISCDEPDPKLEDEMERTDTDDPAVPDRWSKLQEENKHLRELLERLYNISIGLMTIDDDDSDGTWLERMLKAKKVMDEVHKELSDEQ